MNTMKICSGCQKPLEANAPDGLCPECLLKAGLGTGVDLGPDSQAESGQTAFVAPSLEEMARLFPHLELLGCISQEGMGAVYEAQQRESEGPADPRRQAFEAHHAPVFAEKEIRNPSRTNVERTLRQLLP
jgi:hypothetical protein